MGVPPLPDHPPGEKTVLFSRNRRQHGLERRYLQKIVFLEGGGPITPCSGAREKIFFDFFLVPTSGGPIFGPLLDPFLDPFWVKTSPVWSLWVTIEA